MTQEEKELLLVDLRARLPYEVKGIITYNRDEDIFTLKDITHILFLSDAECCEVEDFKPYLRPMPSMIEQEDEYPTDFDWLNAHHFDYRGLIEKGLALEAPKGMYT